VGRVSSKVIVVTGGARGIGRGCAELVAREGAAVVIGDVQEHEGEAVAEAICQSGGRALSRRTDVTHEEDCVALMEAAVRTYGRLDGLVNNVGWFPRADLEETTAELWHRVLDVNLTGAFYCCKHAAPLLRASGGGSIVNMGSINGIQGLPRLLAYSAAKGGLLSMTRTLAGALAPDRIRVNYVVAGWILTDTEVAVQIEHGLEEDELRRQGEDLALGRHQTVEDVAYAVLYLLSDESSQVTGSTLNVDAGLSVLPLGARGSPLGK
jgi:NAD(P)-dependent dehydrogenase (short-subunit alcohol dehydrogenase family)